MISPKESWYCYILRNKNPQYAHLTYNGSTNDPKRRLRQHNEEITGGARYTHGRGGGWEIYALVTGFPDHKNALSCEWRIKHTSGKPGKRPPQHCGMRGRIVGLGEVLKLERWTKQCTTDNKDMNLTLYLAQALRLHGSSFSRRRALLTATFSAISMSYAQLPRCANHLACLITTSNWSPCMTL